MLSARGVRQMIACLGIFVFSAGQSEREIALHLSSPDELSAVPRTVTVERMGGHTGAGDAPGTTRPWPPGAGSTTLSLDDDAVWRLQLEGPGLWSPEVIVDLLGDDDPAAVDLPVLPTAPVRWSPQLPQGAELSPEGTSLSFQPVSEEASRAQPTATEA